MYCGRQQSRSVALLACLCVSVSAWCFRQLQALGRVCLGQHAEQPACSDRNQVASLYSNSIARAEGSGSAPRRPPLTERRPPALGRMKKALSNSFLLTYAGPQGAGWSEKEHQLVSGQHLTRRPGSARSMSRCHRPHLWNQGEQFCTSFLSRKVTTAAERAGAVAAKVSLGLASRQQGHAPSIREAMDTRPAQQMRL